MLGFFPLWEPKFKTNKFQQKFRYLRHNYQSNTMQLILCTVNDQTLIKLSAKIEIQQNSGNLGPHDPILFPPLVTNHAFKNSKHVFDLKIISKYSLAWSVDIMQCCGSRLASQFKIINSKNTSQ